jgi:hypothetical protein
VLNFAAGTRPSRTACGATLRPDTGIGEHAAIATSATGRFIQVVLAQCVAFPSGFTLKRSLEASATKARPPRHGTQELNLDQTCAVHHL